jgi:two-component system, NarL family, response regulator NreC
MSISILLADDHEIFRQGLNMLLGTRSDYKVVGEASDGNETINKVQLLHPDLVIVDMVMPGMNGLEIIKQLISQFPEIRIIVLSLHDDENYVVNALRNGASGYVLKESSTADLIHAIDVVMRGQRFLSPSLDEKAIQAFIKRGTNDMLKNYYELSDREREILQLTVSGMSRSEIAAKLFISIRTVETHRANIFNKLGIHKQSELIEFARKNGLQ